MITPPTNNASRSRHATPVPHPTAAGEHDPSLATHHPVFRCFLHCLRMTLSISRPWSTYKLRQCLSTYESLPRRCSRNRVSARFRRWKNSCKTARQETRSMNENKRAPDETRKTPKEDRPNNYDAHPSSCPRPPSFHVFVQVRAALSAAVVAGATASTAPQLVLLCVAANGEELAHAVTRPKQTAWNFVFGLGRSFGLQRQLQYRCASTTHVPGGR